MRVISATHRNPADMIAKGQFRDDLYYRLNGITLRLPPLRERNDAAELIRKLLRIEAGAARSRSRRRWWSAWCAILAGQCAAAAQCAAHHAGAARSAMT